MFLTDNINSSHVLEWHIYIVECAGMMQWSIWTMVNYNTQKWRNLIVQLWYSTTIMVLEYVYKNVINRFSLMYTVKVHTFEVAVCIGVGKCWVRWYRLVVTSHWRSCISAEWRVDWPLTECPCISDSLTLIISDSLTCRLTTHYLCQSDM